MTCNSATRRIPKEEFINGERIKKQGKDESLLELLYQIPLLATSGEELPWRKRQASHTQWVQDLRLSTQTLTSIV